MWFRRSVFVLFALSYRAVAAIDDDEWELYGCADDPQGKAACFCGFLRDAEGPVENILLQSSSGAMTPCTGGSAGGYPCSNVDLQSVMPLSTFGSSGANDVWGWTDSSSGREFAIIGLRDGTGFVEITSPASPIYLGKLPTHTSSSSWRDIKTYNDHAFIVSEASGHGVQVFDLTELLTVASPPETFSETTHYGVVGSAHNIAINEDSGYAFVVGANSCSGGLVMIDISNPLSPSGASCFSSDGYTHDVHCVIYQGPDTFYQGREICFASNEDTVTIVDVTDKATPVQLSRNAYANDGYTHQGWLSEDHRYFVFGDETDEISFGFDTKTLVFDVTDLNSPTFAGSYFGPNGAIDHNLYIHNGINYLASYRAGLRVLRVDDMAVAPFFTEIGYFDIYPSSNSANFNGAWSVYPFFNSGNVVVSGIEQGLFVLLPDIPSPATPAPTPAPTPATPAPTPATPAPTPATPAPTPATPAPTPATPAPTPATPAPTPATPAPTPATSAPIPATPAPTPVTPAPTPATPAPTPATPATPAPTPATPAPTPATPAPTPATPAPTPGTSGEMILVALLPNPNQGMSDRDGEFIQLSNPTSSPIDLGAGGYEVCRLRNGAERCSDPLSGQVPAGGKYELCRNMATYPSCDFLTPFGMRNREPYDTILLKKLDGSIMVTVDETTYDNPRNPNAGLCWTLQPDSTWAYEGCPSL